MGTRGSPPRWTHAVPLNTRSTTPVCRGGWLPLYFSSTTSATPGGLVGSIFECTGVSVYLCRGERVCQCREEARSERTNEKERKKKEEKKYIYTTKKVTNDRKKIKGGPGEQRGVAGEAIRIT